MHSPYLDLVVIVEYELNDVVTLLSEPQPVEDIYAPRLVPFCKPPVYRRRVANSLDLEVGVGYRLPCRLESYLESFTYFYPYQDF